MKLFRNLFLIVCLFGSAFTFASDGIEELPLDENFYQLALAEHNYVNGLELDLMNYDDISAIYVRIAAIDERLTTYSINVDPKGYALLEDYYTLKEKMIGVMDVKVNTDLGEAVAPMVIALKAIEAKKAEREQAEE